MLTGAIGNGGWRAYRNSVLYAQFFCRPKTTIKKSLLIKKKERRIADSQRKHILNTVS